MMVGKTALATGLGGLALASVSLMGSTSVARAACEGVGVQASDCTLHYGPIAESPYKDTVPKPGAQTSAPPTAGTPAGPRAEVTAERPRAQGRTTRRAYRAQEPAEMEGGPPA